MGIKITVATAYRVRGNRRCCRCDTGGRCRGSGRDISWWRGLSAGWRGYIRSSCSRGNGTTNCWWCDITFLPFCPVGVVVSEILQEIHLSMNIFRRCLKEINE